MTFDKDHLTVEQNSCLTKLINVYIVYDLDGWLKTPLRNFILKNCMFGETNIVKNGGEEKYVYSGRNSICEWSFGNNYTR